ncbi:methionine ABC transporter substrate-binding protein [Microbacterium mangrovi]|uniref:Methionine ABC transporter substrate-binding protein n=1 Tax=Microbacterium mangrovi TaxID=1348253 RepID=A0A0B2A0F3_9MICO|nr:MetQ/NlpA family ABC transporter substrate-binding protein [Microbacterium mangrovi]KHK95237.1 methionine ABC transporter substrate-binding protein [Microbacterium mangrovi]
MSDAPQTPEPPASLPDKPKRSKTGWIVGIAVAVVVVLVAVGAFVLPGLLSPKTAAADATGKTVTVKIGTTEQAAPYWPILVKEAAKEGIDLQVVGFSDYTQANPALVDKQIDLNLFQHLLFLANFNESAKADLTPLASTLVVPLPLYSHTYKNVADIPRGAKIAIPNDATNQARALLVLQEAGLVKLKNGGTVLSTPADIVASASKVTVLPIDASQTAAALNSADGAIVNNNFALSAGLDPKSAIFQDDPSKAAAQPYINAFVVRAADKSNPTYLKVAALWHTPAVEKAVLADSKNTAVIVDGYDQAKLQSVLDGLQNVVKAAQ